MTRIALSAAAGIGTLVAATRALSSTNLLIAVLSVLLFATFVALVRASFRARPQPAPPASPLAAAEAPPSVPNRPSQAPPARAVRVPATLSPDVVAMALLESSTAAGDAVAVHYWLEDPSSATLRQFTAVGSMVPDPHPLGLDDDPLGRALSDGAARLSSVAAVHVSDAASILWRFALPVEADHARGVVGIDFTSDEQPDMRKLVEVTAMLRPSLAGCLALHVARQETAAARTLLEAARELTRRLDPEAVLDHTLSCAMELSDAATGSVMLLDEDSGQMRIVTSVGLDEAIVRDTRVRAGEGIAGWVLATRKPVLVEDLPGREARQRRGDVRSAMSVPIADEDGILGVLNVGSRDYPARFTDSHMEALRLLGTQTAAALRNARALTSARDLYFATLRALALALETKDPYARGGTERVVQHTVALGEALGLDEPERQSLEVAALLHDIGMSAAGEAVAATDRPLSTFERGLLKLHPVLAAEILEEVPALRNVIPIVYHHHEWFDGRGYVVGLQGESIPLGARILAVTDAFVAMTSDRPYRSAMTAETALKELQDKSGAQFDPEVVAAFVDMMRRQHEPAPDTTR